MDQSSAFYPCSYLPDNERKNDATNKTLSYPNTDCLPDKRSPLSGFYVDDSVLHNQTGTDFQPFSSRNPASIMRRDTSHNGLHVVTASSSFPQADYYAPKLEYVIEGDDDDFIDTEMDTEVLHPSEKDSVDIRNAKKKMKRFRLTHSQTRFLMSEFARQAHPDAAQRERLSREIPGLSPRQVQVWFQNRRAKLKRLTTDDRERTTISRALPPDFDMTQALHSPFESVMGISNGRDYVSPVTSPTSCIPVQDSRPMLPFLPTSYQDPEHGNPSRLNHFFADESHSYGIESGIGGETIVSNTFQDGAIMECVPPDITKTRLLDDISTASDLPSLKINEARPISNLHVKQYEPATRNSPYFEQSLQRRRMANKTNISGSPNGRRVQPSFPSNEDSKPLYSSFYPIREHDLPNITNISEGSQEHEGTIHIATRSGVNDVREEVLGHNPTEPATLLFDTFTLPKFSARASDDLCDEQHNVTNRGTVEGYVSQVSTIAPTAPRALELTQD